MADILTKFFGDRKTAEGLKELSKELKEAIADLEKLKDDWQVQVNLVKHFIKTGGSPEEFRALKNLIRIAEEQPYEYADKRFPKETEVIVKVNALIHKIIDETSDESLRSKLNDMLDATQRNWSELSHITARKVDFINCYGDSDIKTIHDNIGTLFSYLEDEGRFLNMEEQILRHIYAADSNIESLKSDDEKKKVLVQWGYVFGVDPALDSILLKDWANLMSILKLTRPEHAMLILRIIIPGCKESIKQNGLMKGCSELIQRFEYIYPVYSYASENSAESDCNYVIKLANETESLEKCRLWNYFGVEWIKRVVKGAKGHEASVRMHNFQGIVNKLSGHIYSPRPPIRSMEETRQLMDAFLEVYEFVYSLPASTEDYISHFNKFLYYAVELGLKTHSPEQTRLLFQIFKNSLHGDPKLLERFIESVGRYGGHHGLTPSYIRGIQEKLLPALLRRDPQVEFLIQSGNIWGMRKGDFGVGDFLVHCYAKNITPANLNDLLMTMREMPTVSYSRFEQNRTDAMTLIPAFRGLRDFIHDQRPLVNELIKAMMNYFDTGSNKELLSVLERIPDRFRTAGFTTKETLLDQANYYMEVIERVNNVERKTRAIDVLRRLAVNTAPTVDVLPKTSDEGLNAKMKNIEASATDKAFGDVLDYINGQLIAMMNLGEIGIEPNMLLSIAWLERKAFNILQKFTYEDQVNAHREKWFHSLLKFQELTNSLNFDEKEFNSFIKQLVGTGDSEEAYKLISQRILNNISELAKHYGAAGKGHRSGALWSGNITHELIGLIDLRPAVTAVGKRLRAERLLHPTERRTGD